MDFARLNDPILREEKATVHEPPDPFAPLPALAKRLGVEPGGGQSSWWLQTRDGERYDMFKLINALLDRIDGVTGAHDGG